jgi:hypothetical protein
VQWWRKEENFGTELGTGIRMEVRKWEHILIKYGIPRDVDTTRSNVEELVAFIG